MAYWVASPELDRLLANSLELLLHRKVGPVVIASSVATGSHRRGRTLELCHIAQCFRISTG